MPEQQLTKKQRQAQRQAEKHQRQEQSFQRARQHRLLKWIIIFALIGITVLGIFAVVSWSQRPTPDPDPAQVSIPALSESDTGVKGSAAAKLTIIEYSDFECPACKKLQPILKAALTEFDSELRIVFRHFPLPFHDNALLTSQAAEAAHLQGKFWEMHDLLYDKQDEWSKIQGVDNLTPQLKKYAAELDLNVEQFETDLMSDQVIAKVQQDYNSANQAELQGTPSLYINQQSIALPRSYYEFRTTINQYLQSNP